MWSPLEFPGCLPVTHQDVHTFSSKGIPFYVYTPEENHWHPGRGSNPRYTLVERLTKNIMVSYPSQTRTHGKSCNLNFIPRHQELTFWDWFHGTQMPMRFVSVMKDAPYSPAENMTIDALGFQVASQKKRCPNPWKWFDHTGHEFFYRRCLVRQKSREQQHLESVFTICGVMLKSIEPNSFAVGEKSPEKNPRLSESAHENMGVVSPNLGCFWWRFLTGKMWFFSSKPPTKGHSPTPVPSAPTPRGVPIIKPKTVAASNCRRDIWPLQTIQLEPI